MNIKKIKHFLFAVIITVILACCCSMTVSADVWDGQGSPVPLLA